MELRPVAVDFAQNQLRAVDSLQGEFGVRFPTVSGNAEAIPFDEESFDLAISEYGVSLWSDPRRWLPEARRVLRPEGRLVFLTANPILTTCTPMDGGRAQDRLLRKYFGLFRTEFDQRGPVEFHLTHGHWIRLLRSAGFVVDDLIEVRPHPAVHPRYDIVSPEWAQQWPSEDVWIAHKA
jgi:SAM-dependent methyltransferase